MKTFVIAMACVLAVGGCKKKKDDAAGAGASSCAKAINSAIDGMMASSNRMRAEREKAGQQMPPGMAEQMNQVAEKLRTVLTTSCEADKWSDAVIACFSKATSQPEIKKCREGLPPDQAQRLQAEIIKVMGGGARMAPGHGGDGAHGSASGSGSASPAGSAIAPAGSGGPAGPPSH